MSANPSWSRPYPAHRIADNFYYVGTEDLACFLITTPQGHILINTGLADSTKQLRASAAKLGFRLEDVRILLNMQAHFDHVAAMEEIRKLSGAKVFASEADARVLEDGGMSDPYFGGQQLFSPVKVDRRLKHGDSITLGGVELKVVATPGHTIGSLSYTTTLTDNGAKRTVAIVNMGTVVMPLKGNPKYPHIISDYQVTFAHQQQLAPDIWVAAHASQYGMSDKHRRGSFVDPAGYLRAVEAHEKGFREHLANPRKYPR